MIPWTKLCELVRKAVNNPSRDPVLWAEFRHAYVKFNALLKDLRHLKAIGAGGNQFRICRICLRDAYMDLQEKLLQVLSKSE